MDEDTKKPIVPAETDSYAGEDSDMADDDLNLDFLDDDASEEDVAE